MRRICSSKSQFVNAATTRRLHVGPGKIYALIAVASAADTLGVYDCAGAPAAADALLYFTLTPNIPLALYFPQNTPPVFHAGLTVVTGAATRAFVITEAEE